MEKTSVTLSVFHDGQFFTALFERNDEHGFSASRTIFGAKPSDIEILELILKSYGTLRYSPPTDSEGEKPMAMNPKKRQREAAKAAQVLCISTKAQAALQAQHEQHKTESKTAKVQRREQLEDEKFEKRQMKKKQKHRGR